MQLEGIYFFDTYAPVIQWTTVCLMLILEVLLGLKQNQDNVTAAFLHADLEEGKNVFVEIPKGFEQYAKNDRKKILKLKLWPSSESTSILEVSDGENENL